jgi:hypothetical protein
MKQMTGKLSLHQLYRKGLVILRSTELEEFSSYTQSGRYAKYSGLTKKGREVAKRLKARVEEKSKSTVSDGRRMATRVRTGSCP